MKAMLIALLLCFALPAVAQDRTVISSRDAAIKDFGRDLAAMQSQVHADGTQFAMLSHGSLTQQQYASFVEDMLGDAVAQAQRLADKWRASQDVHVTGFTVALSITGPEVSVAFELK